MWLSFAAIGVFVAAVGPAVALHVYEVRRWRRETGRQGGWLAVRYDSDDQREARRTGRAYLGLLVIPWFLFGMSSSGTFWTPFEIRHRTVMKGAETGEV